MGTPTNLNNHRGVGCPTDEPQSHVGHGHLGDAHFSRLCVGLSVGPQVGHIHLLSLVPHGFLVCNDGLDDEHVGAHDDEERNAVIEYEDADSERTQVVIP